MSQKISSEEASNSPVRLDWDVKNFLHKEKERIREIEKRTVSLSDVARLAIDAYHAADPLVMYQCKQGASTPTATIRVHGVDSISPENERLHAQLETILGSGVSQIVEAITSNLAAFEAFALMLEQPGAENTKTGKQKKDTSAELDRASKKVARGRKQIGRIRERLEKAASGDRRREKGDKPEAESA